jgi:tetratricopeptide (TPR) repeat protein
MKNHIHTKLKAGQHLQQGEFTQASELLVQMCRMHPDDADAWTMLATAYSQLQDIEKVTECCHQLVRLRPEDAWMHYNLGVALQMGKSLHAAAHAYHNAIRIMPGHASAHANLGLVLNDLGDIDAAISSCDRSLELNPNQAHALNTLGIIYRDLQHFDKSLDFFDRAARAMPDYAEALWNKSLVQLTTGNFKEGWEGFESRWRYEPRMIRKSPYLAWAGTTSGMSNVLVYPEQGIGDQIMFASCLQDLAACVEHVTLCCEPRLESLFSRSFPGIEVLPAPVCESYRADIEGYVSIGSLPRYFRHSLNDFPGRAYLQPDEDRLRSWKVRMSMAGRNYRIGISWRGGAEDKTRKSRSIPLEQWKILGELPGISLFNLQYGDHGKEIRLAENSHGIHLVSLPGADPLIDMDSFAAQICALDLVITVDNSTAHLAGALGIQCWVLLSRPWDWRWIGDSTESPWYSSVRLFRKPAAGTWDDVFEDVLKQLRTTIM